MKSNTLDRCRRKRWSANESFAKNQWKRKRTHTMLYWARFNSTKDRIWCKPINEKPLRTFPKCVQHDVNHNSFYTSIFHNSFFSDIFKFCFWISCAVFRDSLVNCNDVLLKLIICNDFDIWRNHTRYSNFVSRNVCSKKKK